MILYLTSNPAAPNQPASAPSFRGLNPKNQLVENLKEDWKEPSKCLLLCSNPDALMKNNEIRFFWEKSIKETGLSVSAFDLCDSRNGEETAEKLCTYDVLILAGGHVPTQNRFFHRIGLAQAIREYDGLVLGVSAGAMNCAETVYAQPESAGNMTDSQKDWD